MYCVCNVDTNDTSSLPRYWQLFLSPTCLHSAITSPCCRGAPGGFLLKTQSWVPDRTIHKHTHLTVHSSDENGLCQGPPPGRTS